MQTVIPILGLNALWPPCVLSNSNSSTSSRKDSILLHTRFYHRSSTEHFVIHFMGSVQQRNFLGSGCSLLDSEHLTRHGFCYCGLILPDCIFLNIHCSKPANMLRIRPVSRMARLGNRSGVSYDWSLRTCTEWRIDQWQSLLRQSQTWATSARVLSPIDWTHHQVIQFWSRASISVLYYTLKRSVLLLLNSLLIECLCRVQYWDQCTYISDANIQHTCWEVLICDTQLEQSHWATQLPVCGLESWMHIEHEMARQLVRQFLCSSTNPITWCVPTTNTSWKLFKRKYAFDIQSCSFRCPTILLYMFMLKQYSSPALSFIKSKVWEIHEQLTCIRYSGQKQHNLGKYNWNVKKT